MGLKKREKKIYVAWMPEIVDRYEYVCIRFCLYEYKDTHQICDNNNSSSNKNEGDGSK